MAAKPSTDLHREFKGLTLKPKEVNPGGNKKTFQNSPSTPANTSKACIILLKAKWLECSDFFPPIANTRVQKNRSPEPDTVVCTAVHCLRKGLARMLLTTHTVS